MNTFISNTGLCVMSKNIFWGKKNLKLHTLSVKFEILQNPLLCDFIFFLSPLDHHFQESEKCSTLVVILKVNLTTYEYCYCVSDTEGPWDAGCHPSGLTNSAFESAEGELQQSHVRQHMAHTAAAATHKSHCPPDVVLLHTQSYFTLSLHPRLWLWGWLKERNG